MTNQEIYKRTLKFSMYQLGYDLMALLVSAAIIVGMFYLGDKANNHGLIGLAVGIVLGIIILLFILRYNGYTYKAAQIAMMTRAVQLVVEAGGVPPVFVSANLDGGEAHNRERKYQKTSSGFS